MVLWGYPPLIYSQTGNQKSNSEISQLEVFKQVVWRWFKRWKKSVCWVCVFTQKGPTVDILPYSQLCCFPYWFAEEHNCDMHPYIMESHYVTNMQDGLLQLTQLIQYRHVSLFSTVITNHFIWEEFCLGQTSIDGYKAMGFDVTQLTQVEEQVYLQ